MRKVFFWSSVLAVFFALLQAAVLSNIVALPAMPDLVLLTVLYVSLKNGAATGCTSGFISGLIVDFLSAAPVGLNAMTKTITGYIAGNFHDSFNLEKGFVPFFIAAVATLFKAALTWVLSFLFGSEIIAYKIAASPLWFETVINAVCSPLIFKTLGAFESLFVLRDGKRR